MTCNRKNEYICYMSIQEFKSLQFIFSDNEHPCINENNSLEYPCIGDILIEVNCKEFTTQNRSSSEIKELVNKLNTNSEYIFLKFEPYELYSKRKLLESKENELKELDKLWNPIHFKYTNLNSHQKKKFKIRKKTKVKVHKSCNNPNKIPIYTKVRIIRGNGNLSAKANEVFYSGNKLGTVIRGPNSPGWYDVKFGNKIIPIRRCNLEVINF